MTCNEFRDRMESGWLREPIQGPISEEFAAHIESCSSCGHWFAMEERLNGQLRLLRESAPPIPDALDASVLLAYRRVMREPVAVVPTATKRWPSGAVLWRVAIAAMILIAGIVLFGNKKVNPPQAKPVAAETQPAPITNPEVKARNKAVTPSPSEQPRKERRELAEHRMSTVPAHKTRPTVTAGAQSHQAIAPTVEDAPHEIAFEALPPGFRDLMYCDQLSCSGTMEVIRMDLPASALGVSSPLHPNNVVAADVVLGADGVARAIRILY